MYVLYNKKYMWVYSIILVYIYTSVLYSTPAVNTFIQGKLFYRLDRYIQIQIIIYAAL